MKEEKNEIELFEVYDENNCNVIYPSSIEKPFCLHLWYDVEDDILPTNPKWEVKVYNVHPSVNPFHYINKELKYVGSIKKFGHKSSGLVYINENCFTENPDGTYNITFIGKTDMPTLE